MLPTCQVVTISATFGALGSRIGPEVARRLELPFVDRAIPTAVAAEAGCSLEEALAHDDQAKHGFARLFASAARLPTVAPFGMDIAVTENAGPLLDDSEFVERTEQVIRELAAQRGGVFLGRAGACVLAEQPGALHVRLDGPKEARVSRLVRERRDSGEIVDESHVRATLEDNDRARTAYVKHFYRTDPADPRLYHLVVDSTALSAATCIELVVCAARDRTSRPEAPLD